MYTHKLSRVLLITFVAAATLSAQITRRPLKLDDLARFRDVRDPQLSPDGQWVAYVVSTTDTKEDKSNTHIRMVGYDGKNDRQITFSNDSETRPAGVLMESFCPSPLRARANPASEEVRCGCSIAAAARLISLPN